ncbi:MAG: FecR domain-containing protein [Rhizobiales bacterium]|nr:FecR domain-containing protein [Hyphomicrobiales bacterium]
MKSPSALPAFAALPTLLYSGLLILSASSLQAAPRDPIGSALVVVNLVTAEYNRDTRTLQNGDRVHQDEMIEVGNDASSELKLDDDTKLALGPGSNLKLDKFVYDPEKTKGSIVLDLVKGTFRFMTGVAEKPTYVIKTPSAAITVRGTIFDVFVQENGPSWLLLIEGAVRVCNERGTQCRDLTEPGKLIRISNDGNVAPPTKWASLEGKNDKPFDDAFPFVGKPPSIDPTPVLTRDIIILGNLPDDDKPKEVEKPKKRTETTRPTKKKTKKTEKTEKTKPKKKRTASSKDDDAVSRGVGTAIGIGIGLGIGKIGGGGGGRHHGGGGSTGGRQRY